MGAKRDINWTKLKKTIKTDVVPHVEQLKQLNVKLDNQLCELYKVFQTKSSVSFYKSYAGHIDNNNKWYVKFNNYNTGISNLRVVSK